MPKEAPGRELRLWLRKHEAQAFPGLREATAFGGIFGV